MQLKLIINNTPIVSSLNFLTRSRRLGPKTFMVQDKTVTSSSVTDFNKKKWNKIKISENRL